VQISYPKTRDNLMDIWFYDYIFSLDIVQFVFMLEMLSLLPSLNWKKMICARILPKILIKHSLSSQKCLNLPFEYDLMTFAYEMYNHFLLLINYTMTHSQESTYNTATLCNPLTTIPYVLIVIQWLSTNYIADHSAHSYANLWIC